MYGNKMPGMTEPNQSRNENEVSRSSFNESFVKAAGSLVLGVTVEAATGSLVAGIAAGVGAAAIVFRRKSQ